MIRLDKALPEQQPAPANPIIISTTSSQNDLLKTSLKGLSLLEARRFLKTLTTKSKLVVPKRPSSQSLFIPSGMPAKLTNTYRQTQMKILSNYQIISKTVGAELAHAVLPLSYITDVDVKGTSSQWLKLHLDMCEYPSAETIKLSSSLVKQLSKRWPSNSTKFSIASSDKFKPKPELLNQSASQSTDLILVSLTSPTPRNELDILIDAMYMSSDLSRSEIASNLDSLSYQQKSDSLSDYLKADSVERETLIGKISYELDFFLGRFWRFGLLICFCLAVSNGVDKLIIIEPMMGCTSSILSSITLTIISCSFELLSAVCRSLKKPLMPSVTCQRSLFPNKTVYWASC